MKRIPFFAIPSDIVPVLQHLESQGPLKFVLMGNLEYPNRPIYLTSGEIPNPGVATHESGVASVSYMVSLRDTRNNMRKIAGKNGTWRWTLANSENAGSIILTMAGLWKGDIVIEGVASTIHNDAVAQQLMQSFMLSVKTQSFIKVDGAWVGPTAYKMLTRGSRLTQAAIAPAALDLGIP